MSYRPPKKTKKAKSNMSDEGPVYEPVTSSAKNLNDPDAIQSPQKSSNLVSPTSEIKEQVTPNTEAASSVNESLFESNVPANSMVDPPTENKILEEPGHDLQQSELGQSEPDTQTDMKTPERIQPHTKHLETEEFGSSQAKPHPTEAAAPQLVQSSVLLPTENTELQNTSETNHANSDEEFEKKSRLSDPHRSRENSGSFAQKCIDVSGLSDTLVYKTAYFSLLKLQLGFQLFSRSVQTA